MRKAGEISNIRLLYHSLSEEIIAENLASLKFLCGDYLTPVRLEKIDDAKQLFSAIAEVVENEFDQLELLAQLFEKIHRRDLKSKVQDFQQSRKAEINESDSRQLNNDYNASSTSSANYGRAGTSPLQGEQSFLQPGTSSNWQEPSYSLEAGIASYSIAGEVSDLDLRQMNNHNALSTSSANYGTHSFPQNSAEKFGQQETEDVGNSSYKPWGHAPTDSQDSEVNLNGVMESRDQPDQGSAFAPSVRSTETCSTIITTSSTSAELQEKVPVENCMATNSSNATNQKCPVEMSYECIRMYCGSGEKVLGQGGFGFVYEGTRKYYGQDVVVKEEYSTHVGQSHSKKQLKREKRVGYVKHPHLMPLYAFSEEKGKPCCLMYPRMHSDLKTALLKDKNGQEKLAWENRVRIALHTARAMQYLHTGVKNERNIRQEIVHMDVKPGNIFLDEEFNARLGDAGMAHELRIDHSYASVSQICGTDGYKDEYCQGRQLRPINDIFSFGVVLLELLTQRKAVERNNNLHHVLKKEGVLSDPEKLKTKAKMNVWPGNADDGNVTKEFASIAIDCLKPPDERASLHDICKRLEAILERKRIEKVAIPKQGVSRCASCLLNPPAKFLTVRSSGCDGVRYQGCTYFCVTCLTQAQRNPLECPSHGPAEPLIGGSDIYAVLVCGNDPDKKNANIFERDLSELRNVLEDCRIVGVRRDHIYCTKPDSSCDLLQAANVKQTLQKLKQDLEQQGKKDVFLYFYFTGHSDQRQNLICSSVQDVLAVSELKVELTHLKGVVGEFLIILDCCYADGNIVSDDIRNEAFLVHKSPVQADKTAPSQQLPDDFCRLLDDEEDCEATKDLVSTEVEKCEQDTLDGKVLSKAARSGGVTVRQWSSSLSGQSSYGRSKGSFLTQYLVRGLRGAQSQCPLTKSNNCSWCKTFKAQAESVGYITAANLEAYISKHVDMHVRGLKFGELRQTPCMRSLHSNETVLAYYSKDVLRDEVIFKSPSGGIERIAVDKFPLTLLDFKRQLFSNTKVKDNLPNCAELKHLQILCDGEEITSESYVDLMHFIRQGYDVRCQLRPYSSIVHGPVMLEIQNSKELVISLLDSLLQSVSYQDQTTFELDTNQNSYDAGDLKIILGNKPELGVFTKTPLGNLITEIVLTASSCDGLLTVHVLSSSLDCSFKAAD